MSALQEYFKKLEKWENEKTEIDAWKQFQASLYNVEEFAQKKLNKEPVARDENGHETPEKILCSKCDSISDQYRFGSYTDHLEFISDAMRKYKTSEPIILFRGVSGIPMEKMVESAEKLNEEGIDFYEKGYMSCSLVPERAKPYKVQLVIYIPPFSNVMYAGHCNDEGEPNNECQYECIIGTGAKLRIVQQIKDKYYCILEGTDFA